VRILLHQHGHQQRHEEDTQDRERVGDIHAPT
jgi:hypothetical protein